jgi:hypothetical protein
MTAADPGGDAAFVEAFDSGHPEGGPSAIASTCGSPGS